MRWTDHGERQIYSNPWVNLWLVDVQQPDGHRWEHHVFRADDATYALPQASSSLPCWS